MKFLAIIIHYFVVESVDFEMPCAGSPENQVATVKCHP